MYAIVHEEPFFGKLLYKKLYKPSLTFYSLLRPQHRGWRWLFHNHPGLILPPPLISPPSHPESSFLGWVTVSLVTPHVASGNTPDSWLLFGLRGVCGACASPRLLAPDWVWTCGPSCAFLHPDGFLLIHSSWLKVQLLEAQAWEWKWTWEARGGASQQT